VGLERLLSEDEPTLADGAVLSAHQVDALSGTLTALLAEAQRNGNSSGSSSATARPRSPSRSAGLGGDSGEGPLVAFGRRSRPGQGLPPGIAAEASRAGLGSWPAARCRSSCPSCCRCAGFGSSAVSVPDQRVDLVAESTAPSARWGSSSDSRRSRPSSNENCRRQSIEGILLPASISLSAASSARRRAEPGASDSSSASPSWTKALAREQFRARQSPRD